MKEKAGIDEIKIDYSKYIPANIDEKNIVSDWIGDFVEEISNGYSYMRGTDRYALYYGTEEILIELSWNWKHNYIHVTAPNDSYHCAVDEVKDKLIEYFLDPDYENTKDFLVHKTGGYVYFYWNTLKDE